MNVENSDSEEEILVYAEFANSVNIDKYRTVHVLGVDDKNPIIQLDESFFIGKYENALGTFMFFEEDNSTPSKDPLFDKYPEKVLKYVCKTGKLLKMDHAYVSPKVGKVQKNEPRPRRHNKNKESLEDILLKVIKTHVKLDKEEKKKNNTILYSVLDQFFKKMKACDKLFDSLNPKLEYLGSYFDGLRVGHATEYDLNIILTLHLNYNKIKLKATDKRGAYTSLQMPSEFRRLSKTPATANKGFEDTKLWCDPSYRLSVKKFRSWMQRVVDATLNTLPLQNGNRILNVNKKSYEIAAKTSGPANTLTIKESDENIIDVDLVPTLEFRLPQKPDSSAVDFSRAVSTGIKQYFVVPKPSQDDFSWRLAFPFQERYYFYNKHNMKNTVKILKHLRDVQGFNKLASYYIKTVFLWEAIETTDKFWKNNSLSFLVLHMMKKLKVCLENKSIKNFWCPSHNLLEIIKTETCQNWSNRLAYIINVIEEKKKSDPQVILQYLTDNKNSSL